MSKGIDFAALDFAQVSPAPAKRHAVIKMAVLKNEALKISFNSVALKMLGSPSHVTAACADHDGVAFVRLVKAKEGADGAFKIAAPRGRGGFFTIHDHPFEPGVIHPVQEVDFVKAQGGVVITCPDWDEILGALEGEEETEE